MQCIRLTLNVAKSSFMIRGNVSLDQSDVSSILSRVKITKLSVAKLLGIIINDKLKFDDHELQLKLNQREKSEPN